MKLLDVWINCPSRDVADRIAEGLIGHRLAACANVFAEVESVYRWRGAIEREAEVPLLVKTRADLFDALVERTVTLHPYEVPGIIAVPLERVNADYAAWLIAETEKPRAE